MRNTHPNQPVLGLELLLGRLIVVDQGEASAATSTKVCPEAEGDDTGGVGLVDTGELVGEIRLGDVGAVGVENVDDELAAGQQPVRDELARPDRDGCRVVSLERRSAFSGRASVRLRHPTARLPIQPIPPVLTLLFDSYSLQQHDGGQSDSVEA